MMYGKFAMSVAVCIGAQLAHTTAQAKDAFTTYGDVAQYALPATAAILALAKDDTEGFKQFAASTAVTLALTYGLKYSVNSTRPNGGRHSFPSGHSARAFAGAAFIHTRYGWQYGVPAQLAASAVAWSRVDARAHHWYDVVASAGIAHLSAYFLTDHLNENVTLFPVIGGRKPSFGIVGAIRF